MTNRNWKLTKTGKLETHIKEGVSKKEYYLHNSLYEMSKIYRCLNVPQILKYNEETQTMTTVCVGKCNVADFYGEDNKCTPPTIFEKVREIIQLLYDSGIVYPDITGYNFIETGTEGKTKLWIFDFEHAEYLPKKTNDFVEEFLSGMDSWNPDFR